MISNSELFTRKVFSFGNVRFGINKWTDFEVSCWSNGVMCAFLGLEVLISMAENVVIVVFERAALADTSENPLHDIARHKVFR